MVLGGDRAAGYRPQLMRDVLGGDGRPHVRGGHLVDTHPEAIGDHVHRLREERHAETQNRRLGDELVLVFTEAHPVDVVCRCVGEDIDDLVDADLVDPAHHARERERQDVACVTRMNAAGVKGGSAVLTCRADLVAVGGEVRCRIEESARRHDVLSGAQQSADGLGVHDDRRVEDAVGVRGDDGVDVVGRDDADRRDAAISPASLPTLSLLCTRTATRSNTGLSAKCRTPTCPTSPVIH